MISIRHKVLLACEHSGITLTRLAQELGMSQPTLSKRLQTGKLTQDELQAIAKVLGCEYHSYFEFSDGYKLE